MAKFTNTVEFRSNEWKALNPNDEETVIIQSLSVGNINIVLADVAGDIAAEGGHVLNPDTGLGTVFYGLTTKVWARAAAKSGAKAIVTAY